MSDSEFALTQARGEPAANSASAKVESPYEIKIDASHRVLNSPASGGGYIFGAYHRSVGDGMWGSMVYSISISIAVWFDVSERTYRKSSS